MGAGQVLSNRTELKIPYTPSLRWYMMVLGAEPVSSAGRGGMGGGGHKQHVRGWDNGRAQQEDSRASPSSAMGRLLPPPVFMAGLETPCS